jgi:hypothetical protein
VTDPVTGGPKGGGHWMDTWIVPVVPAKARFLRER